MATWPKYLPAPLKNASGEMGSNAKNRKAESGRIYSTRYGSGSPDRWSMSFHLMKKHPVHGDQISAFKTFFNSDLNMGTNWFSAQWLSDLFKYPDHKARILGYPEEKVVSGFHAVVSVNILVKKSSSCPIDTFY